MLIISKYSLPYALSGFLKERSADPSQVRESDLDCRYDLLQASCYQPTGATWLNLVERFFAAITEKQTRRGVHRSTRELETAIYRYIEHQNQSPKLLIWTKTADHILATLARFCERTLDSGH